MPDMALPPEGPLSHRQIRPYLRRYNRILMEVLVLKSSSEIEQGL